MLKIKNNKANDKQIELTANDILQTWATHIELNDLTKSLTRLRYVHKSLKSLFNNVDLSYSNSNLFNQVDFIFSNIVLNRELHLELNNSNKQEKKVKL